MEKLENKLNWNLLGDLNYRYERQTLLDFEPKQFRLIFIFIDLTFALHISLEMYGHAH